jgi:hypothetical protein
MTTTNASSDLRQAATDLVVALKGHSLPRGAESALMKLTQKLTHTPGPWTTMKTFGGVTIVFDSEQKSVAYLRGYKHPYKSNARLIAAAPDLLEALMTFPQSMAWTDDELWAWSEKARAAIDKATGADDGNNS